MATQLSNTEDTVNQNDELIDIWGRRNPRFEKKYEQSVMRILSDYGYGATEMMEAKGKIFGAGYEPYIIAFFIGLYADRKLPLSKETDDLKVLGQPLQFWGNVDSKKSRKAYPKLRDYIFYALVAKTDVDWIAVDRGDIEVRAAVTQLINTMEEYANYGFSVLEEKLKEDRNHFFTESAFLDLFLELTSQTERNDHSAEDEPEDL